MAIMVPLRAFYIHFLEHGEIELKAFTVSFVAHCKYSFIVLNGIQLYTLEAMFVLVVYLHEYSYVCWCERDLIFLIQRRSRSHHMQCIPSIYTGKSSLNDAAINLNKGEI